jgi:hypothetical protein
MLVTLVTVSYPKLPFEIACSDANLLVTALSKHFPRIAFCCEMGDREVVVKANIAGQPDFQLTERHLRAWAQGFMASAHLWER